MQKISSLDKDFLVLTKDPAAWILCMNCYLGIEVDAKTKEITRKTEEKLDGRNKKGHARKKPK